MLQDVNSVSLLVWLHQLSETVHICVVETRQKGEP